MMVSLLVCSACASEARAHDWRAPTTGARVRARRVRNATSASPTRFTAAGVGSSVPCKHGPLLRRTDGVVLRTAVVRAVFWGSTWAAHPGDYIAGVTTFLRGYGFSDYARIATEYGGPNGPISGNVTFVGHTVVATAPTWASHDIEVVSSAALAQVCKLPAIDADGNGIYVVVSDRPRPAAADYCGFHYFGRCRGVRVLYAFAWAGSMHQDIGCRVSANPQLPHSVGLASLVVTIAHELAEIRTDPEISAWQDSCGDELADKCDDRYRVPFVTLANGSKWKLPGLWSNAAYAAGVGYANDRGQRACVVRRFSP